MCIHGDTEEMVLNHRRVNVDKCIAPYVKALNTNGIQTAMSCCGHGEIDGSILTYLDGVCRLIIVCPPGIKSKERFRDVYQRSQEKNDNIRIRGSHGI